MFFKDLQVWQHAMELAKFVYQESAKLPVEERFGLTSQIRRCGVSIPPNIAEGSKRGTKKDYVQFLRIADGSSAELETQLLLAEALYPRISFKKSQELLGEVQRMLPALIKKLSV